jgi:hypothetical protein
MHKFDGINVTRRDNINPSAFNGVQMSGFNGAELIVWISLREIGKIFLSDENQVRILFKNLFSADTPSRERCSDISSSANVMIS